MEHSEFLIGKEFTTASGRWRCTDVGSRTIAAIRLDLDHDPRWYDGPPYAVVERTFDEDDLEGCESAPEKRAYDDSGRSRLVTKSCAKAPKSAFHGIRAVDYTVVLVRDMAQIRRFYEDVFHFSVDRELSPNWVEYQLGENRLTLARPSLISGDALTLHGSASLQLAFRVSSQDVDRCANELIENGIALLSPPTDQSFGHRTLFFRDPDGIFWKSMQIFQPNRSRSLWIAADNRAHSVLESGIPIFPSPCASRRNSSTS